jgi:hypothetical protein
MEGSTVYFATPYVHQGQLPEIEYTTEKGRCKDCNRSNTRLLWTVPCRDPTGRIAHPVTTHNRYRLCQGCAKRRGPPYRLAIAVFVKAISV